MWIRRIAGLVEEVEQAEGPLFTHAAKRKRVDLRAEWRSLDAHVAESGPWIEA